MAQRQDYIIRLIEQLGAALRRLRERLARGVPAAPGVLTESRAAQAELFGPLWPTLRAVDSATAATLVPDSRALRLWAELLRVEAEAQRLLGAEPEAARLEQRASDLLRAADARAH